MERTFYDAFAGVGGFRLGLEAEGWRCIGGCEIHEQKRQVYRRRFSEFPSELDITKIDPKTLPDFSMLCGGFPCPTFSLAGRRLGFEDPRGELIFEILRIVREKRPRILLLENVKGLLSHDRGRTFAVILSALEELGYDAEWVVLNSKYYVPQNRERIFIVGYPRERPPRKILFVREGDIGNHTARRKAQGQGAWLHDTVGAIDAHHYKGGGSRTMVMTVYTKANIRQRASGEVKRLSGSFLSACGF